MKNSLSIVIPAYDEAERLGGTLRQILAYVRKRNLNAELIVVDDGSKDNTAEVAEKAFAEFPALESKIVRYEKNRGKGYAVKTGLLEAKYDIALFSDADLSTPIEETPKLVEPIESGECDVAFGSRAIDRSLIGTHQPWRREQGGKVVNLIIRKMSGLPFSDTQCGFKAFNMKKFRPLLEVMQIDRFGFDVEFLFVANYHKLRLREIPVRWNNVEGSKVSVVRDTRRMMHELTQIRRHARRGVYDLQ
ncbi:MAG TPA: dolichyl-phosphate beta-glucosyltransferase [Pyrinomonadaceae bacterium]|nr:dolichyl-phosphate beta-glucosyltransferase [Pyrinomonadaceae bacterium]